MTRRLLAGLLLTVLTLGWVGTVPQAVAATSTCNGVWVVVDYGSLGGTSTTCAASHGTGKAALTSAGFSPTLDNGMITRISRNPTNPDLNKAYWSYWTATLKSDGSYSGWSYSNLGATSSHPAKGNAEGWRYQSLSDGKVAPGVTPPKGEATPKPTPSPTKTTTKPKPTPSASTRTPTPSATRTATKSATPTASPTPGQATSAASTTASTTGPTTGSTTGPTVTPTPTPSVEATELGQQTAAGNEPPTGGSPVGALVAGGLVLAGCAGIGSWWWLRGRKH